MLLKIQTNVFSLVMLIVFGSQKGISGNKPQTLKLLMYLMDKNFTGNVIWRMVTKNVGMCGHHCYKDDRCRWMAYNSIDNTCQGHSVTYTKQSEGAFISTPGTKNYLPNGNKLSFLGVLANASSFYVYALPVAAFAIDGDLQTFYHSGLETNAFPYLLLKWNSNITVISLIVFKRQESVVFSRFENVFTFVGYGYEDFNLCSTFLAATSDSKAVFTCPYPVEGDTIKIEHRGPIKDWQNWHYDYRVLEIAEVEVYGY